MIQYISTRDSWLYDIMLHYFLVRTDTRHALFAKLLVDVPRPRVHYEHYETSPKECETFYFYFISP